MFFHVIHASNIYQHDSKVLVRVDSLINAPTTIFVVNIDTSSYGKPHVLYSYIVILVKKSMSHMHDDHKEQLI